MFLRNYLTHLQRATAEGVGGLRPPFFAKTGVNALLVRGYFHWSLIDNFEGPTATAPASASCTWTMPPRSARRS
jgi:hypothetical protein